MNLMSRGFLFIFAQNLLTMCYNLKRCVISLSLLLVAACGKKSAEPEKIPIIIMTSVTRATDTAYEEGDAVGLYVVNRNGIAEPSLDNDGNYASNARYTFSGSSWTADTPLFWQDQTTHADFYCYYPYRAPITDVKAVPVSVCADQRGNGYKESELLWGKSVNVAPSQNPVGIVTKHVFSNLLIQVKPGKGYTETSLAGDLSRVTLHSTRTNGLLDLSTGLVTPAGDPVDITPSGTAGAYRAMVVPQALENETLLSLEVGGYTYSMKQSISFLPNKQHSCTVTVNKTSEGINVGISAWEEDDTDYGGVIN